MWRSDGEGRYAGIEPRIPIFQRFDGRFRYARGKQIVGRRWWVVCGSRRDVGARPNLPARNSIRKSTHDLRNKSSLRRPGVAALNHTSTVFRRQWRVVCGIRLRVDARPNLPARNPIRKSTHDLRNKSSLRRPGVAALNHTSTVFRRQWWVVRRICLCVHARPNLPALNSIQKTTHDPQPTKKAARPEKGQAAQILSRRRVASQVVRRTSLVGFLASPSPGINVPAQNLI